MTPLTAPVSVLLDPVDHPPPRGVQLLCVTIGCVLVRSQWTGDMIAWAPLPRLPESVKQRQREKRAAAAADPV